MTVTVTGGGDGDGDGDGDGEDDIDDKNLKFKEYVSDNICLNPTGDTLDTKAFMIEEKQARKARGRGEESGGGNLYSWETELISCPR